MAAAMAGELLGASVHAESAGISADDGASATRDAVRVMKERGLDVGGHRSRSFRALNLSDFDLLVALTPTIVKDVRRAGVEPSKIETVDIPDPYGKGLEVYRTTVAAIERDLNRLFDPDPGRSMRE